MLRDSHRPKHAHALGLHDHLHHLLQRFEGETTGFRGELHREWRKALFVFLQTIHPLVQERDLG